MRVQDPRKFAEKILGWNQDKIASKISTGQNQKVPLSRKLPVHLTYFTAWPDKNGRLRYRADMYKRDEAIKYALSQYKLASN